jgi:DNA-directed RNA polymerase specialized sigma24 family protein
VVVQEPKPVIAAASYDRLVRRIADRESAAFLALYRLMVRPVFLHSRTGLGDAGAAVLITRAVFVEVWRLAPAMPRYDARAWLMAIADRRIAERLRSPGRPTGLMAGYDEHIAAELSALLRPPRTIGPHDDSTVTGPVCVSVDR